MKQAEMIELEKVIMNKYGNTTGLVVLKDGQTAAECYFNQCDADSRFHVYSVTKSIVSILIGIAIDHGYIKDVDQHVLAFFPDYVCRKNEQTIQQITLHHLMSMTAPFRYTIPPYIKYFSSDDWLKFSLDQLGGHSRIGKFRYTPLIGPDILTGILASALGQPVLEFAKAYLFEPLGITIEKSLCFASKEEQMAFNQAREISGWAADSKGLNAGGWGLTLRAMDMAKIGQLLIQNGVWQGKQIVSADWIKESTGVKSRWQKQGLNYGYLWWNINEKERACAAMGDGGNVLYFNAEKQLVIAMTAWFVKKAADRIELIQHIESIFS